jgi:hypothetical protein
VCFQLANIIPIEQPINLLTAERDQILIALWPVKLILRKAFVIEHKTIVLPEQTLDFVTPSVAKRIEPTIEDIVRQLHFDYGGKASIALPKINRIPVKVNVGHLIGGSEEPLHDHCCSS